MKIRSSNIINVTELYKSNMQKTSGDRSKAENSCDRIQISREGAEIAKFVSIAKDIPDARMQKIDEIKSKIQNGTYKVSSDELASKILETINEEKE